MSASPPLPPPAPQESKVEPPPVLGTWPRLYAAVLLNLALLILLFWIFTRAFA